MPDSLHPQLNAAPMPPLVPSPDWLLNLTKETIEQGPLPLLELLQGSVYYPAAGTDGHAVEMLSPYAPSFVHVDYTYGDSKIRALLQEPQCFAGYELVGLRHVEKDELTPTGWRPSLHAPQGHRALPPSANASNSFALWAVFARKSTHGPRQGAERFSLIHLHAEEVAAYDALYRSNGAQARFIAIIRPGDGYGDNWTRFKEPGNFLHQLVMGHPQGPPAYLLYGGDNTQACWPEFEQVVQESKFFTDMNFPNLQLWSRPAQMMDRA